MEIDKSEILKERFKNFVASRIKHVYPVKIPDFEGDIFKNYCIILEALYTYDCKIRLCDDIKLMEKELFFKWE